MLLYVIEINNWTTKFLPNLSNVILFLFKQLTPKEAFRLLSHKFHGKGPGKMKQEKRMRQYQEELKIKQMKNADTPSLSVSRMREAQAKLKAPYLVLSGNVKPGYVFSIVCFCYMWKKTFLCFSILVPKKVHPKHLPVVGTFPKILLYHLLLLHCYFCLIFLHPILFQNIKMLFVSMNLLWLLCYLYIHLMFAGKVAIHGVVLQL